MIQLSILSLEPTYPLNFLTTTPLVRHIVTSLEKPRLLIHHVWFAESISGA